MNCTIHFKIESGSPEEPKLTLAQARDASTKEAELKLLEEIKNEEKWLCKDHLEANNPTCKNCKYIYAIVADLAPLALNFSKNEQKINLKIFNQLPKRKEEHTYRSSVTKMLLIQALASKHLYGHLIVATRETPFNKRLKKFAWPCTTNHPIMPEFENCIDCQEIKNHLKKILEKQKQDPKIIDKLTAELEKEINSYQDAEEHFQTLQTIHAILTKAVNRGIKYPKPEPKEK